MSDIDSKVDKVLIGTRLSSELYNGFVDYLQNECRIMPSEQLLTTEMTQTMKTSAKKTNNSIRKKFRTWTKRMIYSNGVLKHKATEKTIIPELDFLKTIKLIHESTRRHLNLTQTVRQIKSSFTWTSKNFGMDLVDVVLIFCQCNRKKCQRRGHTLKEKLEDRSNRCANKEMSSGHNTDKMSVDDEPEQELVSIDGCNQFDELVFNIHLMRIHVNLSRVQKFRKNSGLRESLMNRSDIQFKFLIFISLQVFKSVSN